MDFRTRYIHVPWKASIIWCKPQSAILLHVWLCMAEKNILFKDEFVDVSTQAHVQDRFLQGQIPTTTSIGREILYDQVEAAATGMECQVGLKCGPPQSGSSFWTPSRWGVPFLVCWVLRERKLNKKLPCEILVARRTWKEGLLCKPESLNYVLAFTTQIYDWLTLGVLTTPGPHLRYEWCLARMFYLALWK